MSANLKIIKIKLDIDLFRSADKRVRNQLIACMHAHNELAVLNRLLMFSMNEIGDGELHDSAQSVQMWSVLQILAGKLFETWQMIADRFLKANPVDPAVRSLGEDDAASLDFLREYFGIKPLKNSTLRTIRDKTAFHYDSFDFDDAIENLATGENNIYLAQHPANCVYYIGSSLIFRAVFAKIARGGANQGYLSFNEAVMAGYNVAVKESSLVNLEMHKLLYALIQNLLPVILGTPMETLESELIQVLDAPDPEKVGLPTFIEIGTT